MQSRKICLIIPPSPFLLDERVFPFLGPLKVAAVLEQAGWLVEVLDLSGVSNYREVVRAHLGQSKARIVGITATTPQFPAAVQIVSAARAAAPRARIILGGTHATLTVAGVRYERSKGYEGRAHAAFAQLTERFDVVVAGDGEKSVIDACKEDAPALIDGDDRMSPYFLTDELLNETPFPARHLLDLDSYHYQIDGARATSLIAQLGCPYRCGFCAGRSSSMLRHIRTRTTENIVAELVDLYRRYGYTGFMFYDDELNVSTTMVELMEEIARVQQELKTTWQLRGFVKSERFTEAQAEAMRAAGFRQLLVGFESGAPRILKNMQKIATREDNSRCMAIARRYGLKIKALMSLGHPGESWDSVTETKRWLIDECPSDFDATIITPYPGSPYYDQAVCGGGGVWTYACANGDQLHQHEVDYSKEADYYKGDPNDGYTAHVWTSELSAEDLVRARNALEHDVREQLGIPFNPSAPARAYEHSMGQTGLPRWILRASTHPPR